MKKSINRIAAVALLAALTAGCGTMPGNSPLVATHNGDPTAIVADDLTLAKRNFHAGNYGLAERHYRRAVERHPENAESWLGLAAAYDQLGRFDLADRAYKNTLKLTGPIPAVLNNQGYSYLLRGDLASARRALDKALAADPNNPHVKGNLELLHQKQRQAMAPAGDAPPAIA